MTEPNRSGMRVYDHTESTWAMVAEGWLRLALSDVISGRDAIPTVSGALAALRIEAGDLPEDDDLRELGLEYREDWVGDA